MGIRVFIVNTSVQKGPITKGQPSPKTISYGGISDEGRKRPENDKNQYQADLCKWSNQSCLTFNLKLIFFCNLRAAFIVVKAKPSDKGLALPKLSSCRLCCSISIYSVHLLNKSRIMHLKRFLSQMNSKEFVKYFLHKMQSLGTSFQLATNNTVESS